MYDSKTYIELLTDMGLGILGNLDQFVPEYLEDIHHIYITFDKSPCPYHNFHHLMGCAVLMDYMCDSMKDIMSADDRDALIRAAMYHDYMYKGSPDDRDNVLRSALAGRERITLVIERLIMHTQFPYVSEPNDPHVDILRDVDILYGTVFHSKELVNRLYLALGHKLKIYNLGDFIERNIEFIRDHEYRTGIAKLIHTQYIDAAINSHYDVLRELTMLSDD